MIRALALPLALLSALASPVTAQASPAAADSLMVYGHADYDWTLQTLAGDRLSLGAYRGRVLFINLWATWCGPCRAELASIDRLRASLHGSDVEFLMISPERPDAVRQFLRRHRYRLPAFTEAQRMPHAFGLRALPTTFIVDRDGRIVLRHRGAADWDREPVRALLTLLARS